MSHQCNLCNYHFSIQLKIFKQSIYIFTKSYKNLDCRIYGFSYPKYRGGPMFYASQIGLQRVYDRICHYHETCRKLFFVFAHPATKVQFLKGLKKHTFYDFVIIIGDLTFVLDCLVKIKVKLFEYY